MAADRFETTREVARVLADGGTYTTVVPVNPRQALVDLWWSALAAARLSGTPVEIHTSEPALGAGDRPTVLVVVQARQHDSACA